MSRTGLEVAIVGMAGRFPGAPDLERFWRNLRDGVESIRWLSDEELTAAGVDPELSRRANYVRARPVVEDVDLFDAHFFGFSPREAEWLDPQHRLFLECAWQALEEAGYAAARHGPSTGVFGGTTSNTYFLGLAAGRDSGDSATRLQALLASDKDYLSTRVSYKLGLEGPSVTVQTACSTSLVAVHLACRALLSGECDLALAGGVSVRVPQRDGYLHSPGEIFSPDGHTRTFDARAEGTVFGSGVGIVALKRLDEAEAAGDPIRAVIRGSAINNDGAVKVGFTAPRVDTQARVIDAAQRMAEVEPETISYIEAHGTGTPLGDPIEMSALGKVFANVRAKGCCGVGSVKSNLGHLETSAGIAGLIKTVLALEHRELPPSLHFTRPNPQIDFDGPFYVTTALEPWDSDGAPRRAGVSSFGIGGTNAHVVLEEAPARKATGPSRPWQLLLLSAKTPTALVAACEDLGRHLERRRDGELPDVAFTLMCGRRTFPHRRMLLVRDRREAVAALSGGGAGGSETAFEEAVDRPVAFMFPGQGSQHPGMGRELYRDEPTFRREVDRCAALLAPELGLDLRQLLNPEPGGEEESARRLAETSLTQPALFVVEYALASLWMEWGVRPHRMIGHSVGEYVAACLAGVFRLEDALRLVAARGRLIQELPAGKMLSIPLPEPEVAALLDDRLSLAAVNGPGHCVVSGEAAPVGELAQRLGQRGVECRWLHTSHAFHSPMMDPVLEPFGRQLQRLELSPPTIPVLSNLTGEVLRPEEATDPNYWIRHLRRTVRFGDGLRRLFEERRGVLLEVGPGTTLSTLARRHPECPPGLQVIASQAHPTARRSPRPPMSTAFGRLWLAGVRLDPEGYYAHERRGRVALPTYPFERRRYWLEAPAAPTSAGPELAERPDVGDWFYAPSWKRTPWPAPAAAATSDAGPWLLLLDDLGLGRALAEGLAQRGHEVVTAVAGDAFEVASADGYRLRPDRPQDYAELVRAVWGEGPVSGRIVHLWTLTGDDVAPVALERPFYSLLYLARALAGRQGGAALEITVVSDHLQEVTGEEVLQPEKATLSGPCRVIPQELAGVRCRSLDISLPAGRPSAGLVERLLTELEAPGDEPVVAYRGRHRWTQGFDGLRLPADAAPGPRLRPRAVVLITGGFGGIGGVLARQLAAAVGARLVLLGRSPLPPPEEREPWLAARGEADPTSRRLLLLRDLEELGAEVLAVTADVTDRAAVYGAVAKARDRFGEIHGVIHAAGVPGGGLLALRTRREAEEVLGPKVAGARHLEQALADDPLDFFLLCSSTIAVLGGVGQVDYCAANSFLDAFAADHGARRGVFTLSVNWDRWREVGMAVAAAEDLRRAGRERPAAHPLLGSLVEQEAGRRLYESFLSPVHDWTIAEHRVMGHPVLPGTAFLEMARAAAEEFFGDEGVELREVAFVAPLVFTDEAERQVQTVLRSEDEGLELTVRSRTTGGDWQEHAVGKAFRLVPSSAGRLPIAAIEARCGRPLELPPNARSGGEGRLVRWGPRWDAVKTATAGDGEGLARIELPEAFREDLRQLPLHPALLDRATSFLLGAVSKGSYLPFFYRSLRIRAPLPAEIVSHAVCRFEEGAGGEPETVTLDVAITDAAGDELVTIEEFTLRRLDPALAARRAEAGDAVPPAGGRGIGSAQGAEAFARLLAAAQGTQVVVSTRDFGAVVAQRGRSVRRTEPDGSAPGSSAFEARPRYPRPALETPYKAPRTPREELLAGLWEELLGIDRVGVEDNFFELGGDSILGIQILSRAREEGLLLTGDQLFAHQTIAELVEVVGEVPEGAAVPPAEGPDAGSADGDPTSFPEAELEEGELEELIAMFGGGAGE